MRTFWTIIIIIGLGLNLDDSIRAETDNTGDPPDSTVSIAPAFELSGLDGKIYRLSDYRGSKPLVVWFTNLCGGCQANIPHLDSVYRADIKPRAELLAVSLLGEDKETVAKISKKLKLQFPILLDPKGKTCEDYVGQYVKASCPLMNLFVIDRQGVIKYETHYPGYEEAEALSAIRAAIGQENGEGNSEKESGQ
jgi:peroxiredoxin